MIKVTIAIPTYNRKEYLQECIESVLNQSFQDYKIVIFDNHSDYDVVSFLNTFQDKRISLLQSSENIGNRGNFERVFNTNFDTEYLVVFHDDDVMHPDFLNHSLSVFDKNEELAWVGSAANFVKKSGDMQRFKNIPSVTSSIHDSKGLVRLLLNDFDLCFDSVVYRVDCIQSIAPFAVSFSKWLDRPFLVNLARKSSVGIIRERLINYRVHAGQDSQDISDNEIKSSMECAYNLFALYQSVLRDSKIRSDEKLLLSFTTNNVLSFAKTYAKNVKEYRNILNYFRIRGVFSLTCVNQKGLYYLMRAVLKMI